MLEFPYKYHFLYILIYFIESICLMTINIMKAKLFCSLYLFYDSYVINDDIPIYNCVYFYI